MSDEKPKLLRLVAHDEKTPPPKTEAPSKEVVALPPSPSLPALEDARRALDPKVPYHAGKLVNAGLGLIEAARQFHAQAVNHAPMGTFRKGVSPGQKSAEATEAWLLGHKDGLLALLACSSPSYAKGDDLKDAVELATKELERATEAAATAGLKFEGRRDEVLQSAATALRRDPPATTQRTIATRDAFRGLDMLGATEPAHDKGLLLFVGGVIVGAVLFL